MGLRITLRIFLSESLSHLKSFCHSNSAVKMSLDLKQTGYFSILLLVFLLWSSELWCADKNNALEDTEAFQIPWVELDDKGNSRVNLFFFWSQHCPHCREALPFVHSLPKQHHWLNVYPLEITQQRENATLYMQMASVLGQNARSVPAFIFCGNMLVGYRDKATTGVMLETELIRCHEHLELGRAPEEGRAQPLQAPINVPFVGALDTTTLSLPVLTVVLAGLDSFNPCAFFVLLFLMSLMVHARSRARMLVIGGIFVMVSGLVYFLFMSAWLNLFIIVGQVRWMTLIAGILAITLASINIKDFFWYKRGISLSISDSAKPKLFERMRGLLSAENITAMIIGTIFLAVIANSYELLCTAGFPMIYTRVLTLEKLPQSSYYLYLVLYNFIYVIPLLIIVVTFVLTLGSRKLKESEGRTLKLMSGTMMLGLGLLLVLAPDALNNVLVALGLLAVALLVTFILAKVFRDRRIIPHKL